jgi:phosphoglycolate phosphatase
MSYSAVVFDFDLTLVDSYDAFVDAHVFASKAMGLAPPSREAVGRIIGTPLVAVIPILHGAAGAAVSEEYAAIYQKRADETMSGLTRLIAGARETVVALRRAGLKLGIVSQKLRYRLEELLRREGLLQSFEAIIGAEDIEAFKPDPSGLLLAVEQLGATSATALYVGDTVIDAEAARRAGVPFVAVLTGVTPSEAFASHQPRAILDSVTDLPAYLGLT